MTKRNCQLDKQEITDFIFILGTASDIETCEKRLGTVISKENVAVKDNYT